MMLVECASCPTCEGNLSPAHSCPCYRACQAWGVDAGPLRALTNFVRALHAKREKTLEERVLDCLARHFTARHYAVETLLYGLQSGCWTYATLGAAIHVLRDVSGDASAHVEPAGKSWCVVARGTCHEEHLSEREALLRAILYFLEKR